MKNPKIYNMKLFESIMICGDFFVVRVPGGWLMNFYDSEHENIVASTFVQYNNEFRAEQIGDPVDTF